MLPPLTAYYVMRVGTPAAGAVLSRRATWRSPQAVARLRRPSITRCCSPITGRSSPAATLAAAADAIEELEATAKLLLLLRGERVRTLDEAAVAEIEKRFPR